MTLSRRKFLAFGTAAATAGLTGCGSRSSLGGSDELSMWTWVGSVNDGLIGQAEKTIPGHDGIRLAMTRIGSNYKTKVLTALAGKSLVPDIVAINDDVATYFPNADQFHDLNELGAKDLEKDFLPWKWKLGITPENKMMAYPMDTGPTALFYRTDIFQKAGIDIDPAAVAELAPDWDSYIQLGKKLKQAVPGSAITDNITGVFSYALAQQPKRYMTQDGQYIGDQDHIRQAFDLAIRVVKEGLSANAQSGTTDANAVVTNGKLVAYNAAVWWAQLGPKNAAPKTKGLWRVTGTGRPGQPWWVVPRDHEVLQGPRGRVRLHQLAGIVEEPGRGLPRPGPVPVHAGQLHRRADERARPVLRWPEDRRRLRRISQEIPRCVLLAVRHHHRYAARRRTRERRSRRQVAGPGLERRAAPDRARTHPSGGDLRWL